MFIYSIESPSSEVYKITCDKGSFFVKTVYLNLVDPSLLQKNAEFLDEQEEDIINAGLCYSAELKATEYLARAEQSRFGLTQKLLKKNYDSNSINRALDFLEEKNWLNDQRFCRSWLNTRKLSHFEGRTKLSAELSVRGIKKETVKAALDEFFSENDEIEIGIKCYEKCRRSGKDEEKTIAYMIQHGFSYSAVKKIKEEISQNN